MVERITYWLILLAAILLFVCGAFWAVYVWADGPVLASWISSEISPGDMGKWIGHTKGKLKDRTDIDTDVLPEWRETSDTNQIGRLVGIDVSGKGLDYTLSDAENWRTNTGNLSNPDHVRYLSVTGRDDLVELGLEPVPKPQPGAPE